MSNEIEISVITKKELAQKIGISTTTLRYWLNYRYFEELKELGYKKTDKIVLKPVYDYCVYKFCVISEL